MGVAPVNNRDWEELVPIMGTRTHPQRGSLRSADFCPASCRRRKQWVALILGRIPGW